MHSPGAATHLANLGPAIGRGKQRRVPQLEPFGVMKSRSSKEAMQESFAVLGLAIHLLHEIENHFSQATLLGLAEKQKRKHQSINDMWAARDRMTFGQLVPLFKEDWDLQPEFEFVLDKFVEEET
jgi:hypothetical protein